MEDRYLNGPDYDEPDELESSTEEVYVPIDAIILVDNFGNYEYEDTTYSWAKCLDTVSGDWYSESGVFLTDPVGMVENVDDLIIDQVPEVPGRYHISGSATIFYEISGLQEYSQFVGLDEDSDPQFEYTIDDTSGESIHLRKLDRLDNFTCETAGDIATL